MFFIAFISRFQFVGLDQSFGGTIEHVVFNSGIFPLDDKENGNLI